MRLDSIKLASFVLLSGLAVLVVVLVVLVVAFGASVGLSATKGEELGAKEEGVELRLFRERLLALPLAELRRESRVVEALGLWRPPRKPDSAGSVTTSKGSKDDEVLVSRRLLSSSVLDFSVVDPVRALGVVASRKLEAAFLRLPCRCVLCLCENRVVGDSVVVLWIVLAARVVCIVLCTVVGSVVVVSGRGLLVDGTTRLEKLLLWLVGLRSGASVLGFMCTVCGGD